MFPYTWGELPFPSFLESNINIWKIHKSTSLTSIHIPALHPKLSKWLVLKLLISCKDHGWIEHSSSNILTIKLWFWSSLLANIKWREIISWIARMAVVGRLCFFTSSMVALMDPFTHYRSLAYAVNGQGFIHTVCFMFMERSKCFFTSRSVEFGVC